jgi:hypothetical protein
MFCRNYAVDRQIARQTSSSENHRLISYWLVKEAAPFTVRSTPDFRNTN